jgi:hypothetical protein
LCSCSRHREECPIHQRAPLYHCIQWWLDCEWYCHLGAQEITNRVVVPMDPILSGDKGLDSTSWT